MIGTTKSRTAALRCRAGLVCAALLLFGLLTLLRAAGASTLGMSSHSYVPNFFHRACSTLVETSTVSESTTVLETVTLKCEPANRVPGP